MKRVKSEMRYTSSLELNFRTYAGKVSTLWGLIDDRVRRPVTGTLYVECVHKRIVANLIALGSEMGGV